MINRKPALPRKPRARTPETPVRMRSMRKRKAGFQGAYAEATTLAVTDLHVDPSYQRPVVTKWVDTIVKMYNPALFEPLHVALRDDNRYYVIDGQHRLLAAIEMKLAEVPVLLHLESGVTVEATQFAELQQRRMALRPTDVYFARLAAKDEEYLHLNDMLEKRGFHISRTGSNANNHLSCVGALLLVQHTGNLGETLNILRKAWDGHHDSLTSSLIRGISRFLTLYPDANLNDLTAKLHAMKPQDVVLRAQIMAKTLQVSVFQAVAQTLFDLHNRGRSAKRLAGGLV